MIYNLLTGNISPVDLLALLLALVFGITVHEFAHALAATWLGDPLPRRQGRLTLAPAAHLDPMGSLMFAVAGFGWGRPVEYNPYALRGNPRTGGALIAVAGPISNILFAALLAIPARLIPIALQTSAYELLFWADSTAPVVVLYQVLIGMISYNLMLSIFNLIPVPPLDGFAVLQGILPPALAEQIEIIRPYGFFILFLLMFAGSSVLGAIMTRPIAFLEYLLVFAGA